MKRRTAEYLMRAESLSSCYRKAQFDDVSQVRLVWHLHFLQPFPLSWLSALLLIRAFENFGLWNFISNFLKRLVERTALKPTTRSEIK